MKVLYISNFLNIHSAPLFDELITYPNVQLTFLSTKDEHDVNKKILDRKYNVYSNTILDNQVESFLNDFDVLIYGACLDKRFIKKMPHNKIIFHNSEHYWKKTNTPISLTKRIYRMLELKHRYKKINNLYILANSSHLKKEFDSWKIKYKKCFKFGYFPPTNFDKVNYRDKDFNKIVYIGRLLKWKRPCLSIKMKNIMEKNNSNKLSLDFYGEGPEEHKIVQSISERVTLKHFISHDDVLAKFLNGGYFCFSSTKEEGWGAVLNEAMSCGCIVLASLKAGATSFLVKDGINGYTFKTKKEFKRKALLISSLTDKDKIKISLSASKSIIELWNYKIAAKRLYHVMNNLISNRDINLLYVDGPMSE